MGNAPPSSAACEAGAGCLTLRPEFANSKVRNWSARQLQAAYDAFRSDSAPGALTITFDQFVKLFRKRSTRAALPPFPLLSAVWYALLCSLLPL